MSVIKLSPEDKIIVNQCFESLDATDLWSPHAGPFNHKIIAPGSGLTIWLKPKSTSWRLQDVEEIVTLKNLLSKYQKMLRPDIQEGVTHFYGRVYLHRLLPGEFIGRHYDHNDQPYMSYMTRFHLYGDISEGNIIEAGCPIQENSFLQFNHKDYHEYQNHSNTNLHLVVCDLISKKINNHFKNYVHNKTFS